MQQSWQARRQAPDLRVMDTGTVCAIPLGVPNIPQIHLQECVEGWHQPASVHALAGDPAIVVLQLLRYTHHSGESVKVDTRVTAEPGQAIFLPAFSEGFRGTAYPYLVAAVTIHLGPDLLSGHYRSVLLQAEGSLGDLGLQKTASLRPKQQRPTKSVFRTLLISYG